MIMTRLPFDGFESLSRAQGIVLDDDVLSGISSAAFQCKSAHDVKFAYKLSAISFLFGQALSYPCSFPLFHGPISAKCAVSLSPIAF